MIEDMAAALWSRSPLEWMGTLMSRKDVDALNDVMGGGK